MPRAALTKDDLREQLWTLLTTEKVARFPGARGRIPNFIGAEAAAKRLAALPEWRAARTIKCNPDAPQLPVRVLALREGKRLFVAVPRLREERCFLELDPRRLAGRERAAASIRGAAMFGTPTLPRDMPAIDLIVAGSVAVGRDGARTGHEKMAIGLRSIAPARAQRLVAMLVEPFRAAADEPGVTPT